MYKKSCVKECMSYNHKLRRCSSGKINPKTIKGGVSAAEVMGISYICPWCPLKDKIWEALVKKYKA